MRTPALFNRPERLIILNRLNAFDGQLVGVRVELRPAHGV